MQITVTNELRSVDHISLFQWTEFVFDPIGKAYTWAQPSEHIVVHEDKQAIAHLGISFHKIRCNAIQTVLGVGGVVVRPEWQGQGIPKLLFAKLQELYPDYLHTLFCPERLVSYYIKHDYKHYQGSFTVIQNKANIPMPGIEFMFRGESIQADSIQVLGCPW